jgi:translocator protein
MHFDFFAFFACVLICEAVGGVAGLFTQFNRPWFRGLRKSVLQPPALVLEWGWVVIYALMGSALYLIWRLPIQTHGRIESLIIFAFQLALSALWPLIFFRIKYFFLSFVELLVLWMFVLGTVVWFAYLDMATFFLLVPVMAWVLFEAYLNFTLVILNESPKAPSHM